MSKLLYPGEPGWGMTARAHFYYHEDHSWAGILLSRRWREYTKGMKATISVAVRKLSRGASRL